MDRALLFPDAHRDSQEARISGWWDLSWPLPMPRQVPVCPLCSPFTVTGGRMVVKDWKFHTRRGTGTAHPLRCDLRTKCLDCSGVQTHGIAVTDDQFKRARAAGLPVGTWITWRAGKHALAKAGYFEEAQ